MTSRTLFANVFRFLFLVLIQVLVLRRLALEWAGFPYVNALVYPLFLMLLPITLPRWGQFLLAFLLGISVDLFYDSPGIHASAAVFTIYLRPYILRWLEPRGGYNLNHSPAKSWLGYGWFFRYSASLLFFHCLFYFSVEAFNFANIGGTLLRILTGFFFSLIGIWIIVMIFNPKE